MKFGQFFCSQCSQIQHFWRDTVFKNPFKETILPFTKKVRAAKVTLRRSPFSRNYSLNWEKGKNKKIPLPIKKEERLGATQEWVKDDEKPVSSISPSVSAWRERETCVCSPFFLNLIPNSRWLGENESCENPLVSFFHYISLSVWKTNESKTKIFLFPLKSDETLYEAR